MKDEVNYIIKLDFSKKTKFGNFIFKNEIYNENEYCSGILDVTNYVNINFLPRIGDSFILDDELYGDSNLRNLIIDKGCHNIFHNLDYKVKDVEHFCCKDSKDRDRKLHFINILLCLPKKNKHKI